MSRTLLCAYRNTAITLPEVTKWRELCQWLEWQRCHFALVEELLVAFPQSTSLYSYEGRNKRQEFWEKYRIELICWCDVPPIARYKHSQSGLTPKQKGWQLKWNWRPQIEFLEAVTRGENPRNLPMPWLSPDHPRPWDVVLGGEHQPRPGDAVMRRG